jgi:hypothetical protein
VSKSEKRLGGYSVTTSAHEVLHFAAIGNRHSAKENLAGGESGPSTFPTSRITFIADT